MRPFILKHIFSYHKLLLVLIIAAGGITEVKGQNTRYYGNYNSAVSTNIGEFPGAGGNGSAADVGTAKVTPGNINNHNGTDYADLTVKSGKFGSFAEGQISTAYINLDFTGTTPIANKPILIKLEANILNLVEIQAFNNGTAGLSLNFSQLINVGTNLYTFTPIANCNSIRITVKTNKGSLLGGPSLNTAKLYFAYITDPVCNTSSHTETSTSSILDLASKITDPYDAIDGNITTFSQFYFGVGIGTTLNQNIYLNTPSKATDTAKLTISIPPAVLAANVLNIINIKAYNGPTLVKTSTFGSLLAGTDLLTLLGTGNPTTIPFIPGVIFDRIEFSMSGLIGLNATLNLYEVNLKAPKPTLSATGLANGILTKCKDDAISITVGSPEAGAKYVWFDAAVGGNEITADLNANGTTFNPMNLTPGSHDYYVYLTRSGCTNVLSDRTKITVIINPKPNLASLSSIPPVCSNTPLSYTAVSDISGTTFTWSRPLISGISNAAVINSTVNPINETLINTTSSPITVVYQYTLSAPNGCSNTVNIQLKVNPKPGPPHIVSQ